MKKTKNKEKKMLTEEQDMLLDAWYQWAYDRSGAHRKGYFSGGLSTLESIEWYFKSRNILTSLGNFNTRLWKRFDYKEAEL